jgi:hypothetical protein
VSALFAGVLASGVLHAEEVPMVVVEAETTCSSSFSARMIRELSLRSTVGERDVSRDENGRSDEVWKLGLSSEEVGSCDVRLTRGEEVASFVVSESVDDLEMASVATRLAWIVDGIPFPMEGEDGEEGEEDAEGEEGEEDAAHDIALVEEKESRTRTDEEVSLEVEGKPEVSRSRDELNPEEMQPLAIRLSVPQEDAVGGDALPTEPPIQERRRAFSLEALGGTMWIPEAADQLMIFRVRAGWNPVANLRLGIAGRAPLGVIDVESGGVRFFYRPWSADLVAGYQAAAGRWGFEISGGARRIFATVSADGLSQGISGPVLDDVSVRGGGETEVGQVDFSSWSLLATARVGFSISRVLAVGLETTLGGSLTERVIHGTRGNLDLGRLDLDMLMGLEVRF